MKKLFTIFVASFVSSSVLAQETFYCPQTNSPDNYWRCVNENSYPCDGTGTFAGAETSLYGPYDGWYFCNYRIKGNTILWEMKSIRRYPSQDYRPHLKGKWKYEGKVPGDPHAVCTSENPFDCPVPGHIED